MTMVDEPTPVIHSPCLHEKLIPSVAVLTTDIVPTSKKRVPLIPCEEESPQSKIPQLESDKESEVSESTKCEIEIIPHLI